MSSPIGMGKRGKRGRVFDSESSDSDCVIIPIDSEPPLKPDNVKSRKRYASSTASAAAVATATAAAAAAATTAIATSAVPSIPSAAHTDRQEDDLLARSIKDKDKVDYIRDIDSVCVVADSLKAFKIKNCIPLQTHDRMLIADKNSKMLTALESREGIECDPRRHRWMSARLLGIGMEAIFILLLIDRTVPTRSVHFAFAKQIIRVAASYLPLGARSRQANLAGFHCGDRKRNVKIFSEDWMAFASAIDRVMREATFLDDYRISRHYFYG